MRLKTEILSCILGIVLANGVCVATQQPIKKDAETQTDVKDAATLADMQEKWFKAVESNNIGEVTRMIEASEINPNVKDNSELKETALHKAAKDPKKSEIAKILINHPSVNVNAADTTKATPLLRATEVQNNAVADLLLEHKKIDVRARDNSTPYPFTSSRNIIAYRTLEEKRDFYFPYLRKKKIKLTDDEYRDMKNFAIDANEAKQTKETREWIDIIVEHMLKERKAPCSKEDQLEWRNAAQSNDLLKMQKLIEKGFDINLVCFPYGTALHNAVLDENIETINFLLEKGADINIYGSMYDSIYDSTIYDSFLCTPLWIAAIFRRNKEILENLLKHPGTDINDPQDALLYSAVLSELEDIVEFLLLQEGININLPLYNGRVPLHIAVNQNNSKILKLLLQQNGIDVNAIDNEKTTPLHIAVKNNKKEAVELLLEKETINITLSDAKQLTPLDIAVQQSSAEITLLLLRKIKGKELKISNETYEKIKQKPNLCSNDEILNIANELKQNVTPAN